MLFFNSLPMELTASHVVGFSFLLHFCWIFSLKMGRFTVIVYQKCQNSYRADGAVSSHILTFQSCLWVKQQILHRKISYRNIQSLIKTQTFQDLKISRMRVNKRALLWPWKYFIVQMQMRWRSTMSEIEPQKLYSLSVITPWQFNSDLELNVKWATESLWQDSGWELKQ